MAYIGGTGHFIGPVLGAIVITWLQSSLSGYTSAWLFYLGVFFIVMILCAPSGIAALIVAHRPLVRSRAFDGVLAAYAIALAPLALTGAGAVLLIRRATAFRRSQTRDADAVLWMELDAASP